MTARVGAHLIWFERTSNECLVNGNRYPGIPVFFERRGIIQPLSDYMIELVVRDKIPTSTVETYAFKLQKFWKWIRSEDVAWDEVDDDTLIQYRDSGLGTKEEKRPGGNTIKAALEVVFSFYAWAERTKRLVDHVAIYPDRQNRTFLISAIPNQQARSVHWTWPHLRSIEQSVSRRPTPPSEQLEALHGHISTVSKLSSRDGLVAQFYEEGALRVSELLGLRTDDIPSWPEIEAALDSDSEFEITVNGKGARKRPVSFLPELMQRAREYIEGERDRIVQAIKERNRAYREPKDLILSSRTGKRISRQALSHRLIFLMRGAGIRNVSGHRIRARALSNIIESADGVDDTGRPIPAEQVLLKAQEVAGHLSMASLRAYLNDLRKTSATDYKNVLKKQSRLRKVGEQLVQAESLLEDVRSLGYIAQLLRKGLRDEARKDLLGLVAALEQKIRQ